MSEHDLVLVVDFGAQYAQLIARRVREARVYSEIVPHSMPVEEMLATMFAEVLQRDACGVHDNFFALGGDSLRAMQVTTRMYAAFGLELHTGVVFERPTVADLAVKVVEGLVATDAAR